MERKTPIKTARIELDGEYRGWWFEVRTNPPVGILLDRLAAFEATDKTDLREFAPALYALLELLICRWNFKDEHGKVLRADIEGLRLVALDLLVLMADKVPDTLTEVINVPKARDDR